MRALIAAALACAALFGPVAVAAAELLGGGSADRVSITMSGYGPTSETLRLPMNKAVIVELPVNAEDVLVTNPDIADVVIRTPRRIYVLGMRNGDTNAFFFDANGRQILNLEIRVRRDVEAMQEAMTRLLPDSRIEVEALGDGVVLSGVTPSTVEAERAADIASRFVGEDAEVLNLLTVSGKEQVLLKVRVVEMQRSVVKQLGIDITNLAAQLTDELNVQVATGNEFSLAGRALGGLSVNGNYTNLGGGDIEQVDATLSALERVGMVRTLAEPNLTAITGEPAKFLAGGEFPVPSGRDNQGNVSVSYKPFGVGLSFTPMVLSDGRISVFVSTEVSELSSTGAVSINSQFVDTDDDGVADTLIDGVTLPALQVRRAETTVELPSGGSLVMAGLIQDRTKQSIDGTPGMKDVPGLGALFRSRDFESEETELVVIVTPYLVEPSSPEQLSSPADGYVQPGDLEAAFLGRLSKIYRAPGAQSQDAAWRGPVGFIIDEEGSEL